MLRKLFLVFLLAAALIGLPTMMEQKNATINQSDYARAIESPQELALTAAQVNPRVDDGTSTAAAQTKPQQPLPPTAPAEIGCGPHTAKQVYDILIEIGVPQTSAVQQVGSWQTESGGDFDQCQKKGDSGIAWGLNSWHPGRRQDMPMELRAQIKWAIHTEMARDCRSCYDRFMQAESVWSVREAIRQSTRWGIQGGRWIHADNFAAVL